MGKLSVLTLINMNPNKLGALEEYALHLSEKLIQRGHFASVGFSKSPPDWLGDKFKAFGIEVVEINSSQPVLAFIRDMRGTIRKYSINILHATFFPFYSPLLIIATMGNGCKLIYSDQESRISHPPSGVRGAFRFLRNRLYQNKIHAIIADAEFVRDCQLRDHFTKPDKVLVIYNGVNLKRFGNVNDTQKADLRASFNLPPDSFVIVTVAQCTWVKGLDYLINAARMIVGERPDAFFFVVGDGPDRPALEEKVISLGLREKFVFTGMRVDTEVFLSVADIFVLPSVWEEAFAFSLLEAMASGCPIVATRIGAIPESVLDGVTGILVPTRDARAISKAILKLLNDDTLRLKMGEAARKRVEENFPLELWVDKTIELYENTLLSPNDSVLSPGS